VPFLQHHGYPEGLKYSQFQFVLTLPTTLAYHLCDSNHTHSLIVIALSQLLPIQTKKKFDYQKWKPHKARRLFPKLICAKEERN